MHTQIQPHCCTHTQGSTLRSASVGFSWACRTATSRLQSCKDFWECQPFSSFKLPLPRRTFRGFHGLLLKDFSWEGPGCQYLQREAGGDVIADGTFSRQNVRAPWPGASGCPKMSCWINDQIIIDPSSTSCRLIALDNLCTLSLF